MNIIIRADKKIGNKLIGEHIFAGKRIIDNFIDFLLSLKVNIFVVSNKKIKINNAKIIPISRINDIKDTIILDLDYIYDERKLKKLIKKGKDANKAIIKRNKKIADLDSFGCLFHRKEWNPISQYYVEPLGEKLAFALRKSSITPNQITFLNIIIGLLASSLIYINTTLSLIIFGIWVRFFHVLDIIDGHLARLQNKQSFFGKWLDSGGDKLVMIVWYATIAATLFLKRNNQIYALAGLVLLMGMFLYNYLSLTTVVYFRNYDTSYTVRKSIISRVVLFFINIDIQWHIITICAIIGRMEYILFFYAIYFNFVWFIYFIYYFVKYLREGDVKDV